MYARSGGATVSTFVGHNKRGNKTNGKVEVIKGRSRNGKRWSQRNPASPIYSVDLERYSKLNKNLVQEINSNSEKIQNLKKSLDDLGLSLEVVNEKDYSTKSEVPVVKVFDKNARAKDQLKEQNEDILDREIGPDSDPDFDIPEELFADVRAKAETEQVKKQSAKEFIEKELIAKIPELKYLSNYEGDTLDEQIKSVFKEMNAVNKRIYNAYDSFMVMYGDRFRKFRFRFENRDPLMNAAVVKQRAADLLSALSESPLASKYTDALTRLGYQDTAEGLASMKADDWGMTFSLNGKSLEPLAAVIEYLRITNGTKSAQNVAKDYLRDTGVVLQSNSEFFPIGKVYVPYNMNGSGDNFMDFEPAVDVLPYANALDRVYGFIQNNILPEINNNRVVLRVSASNKEFNSLYRSLNPKKTDTSRTLGFNSYATVLDPNVPRTDISGRQTIIGINDEVAKKAKPDFGTNPIEETIFHELGHLIHNTMGTDWGTNVNTSQNPKTLAYRKAKRETITEYGKKSYSEHFAESFSKLLAKDDASSEFLKFINETVGIKPFNIDDYFSLQSFKDFPDSYKEWMNEEADLNDWSIDTGSPEYSHHFSSDARDRLPAAQIVKFRDPVFTKVDGKVYTPDRQVAGRFQRFLKRDEDGKLYVVHDLLKLEPEFTGQGFGTDFTRAAEDFYRSQGYDRIETLAGLTNGPYMWALMGFKFKLDREKTVAGLDTRRTSEYIRIYLKNKKELDEIYPDDPDSVSYYRVLDIDKQRKVVAMLAEELTDFSEINRFMKEMKVNGWIVDEELYESFKNVVSKHEDGTLEPFDIANLGRKKKREGRDYSSIGRSLMMQNPFAGVKYLNPETEPKKPESKEEVQAPEPEPVEIRPPAFPEQQQQEEDVDMDLKELVEDMDLKEIVDENQEEQTYSSKDSKDAMTKVLGKLQEALEGGFTNRPWRKPFKEGEQFITGGSGLPRNPATKHIYRGTNAFALSIIGRMMGFKDNRWVTYKQAQNLGGQVPKGVKAPAFVLVPFTKPIYKDKNGNPYVDKDGKPAPRSFVYFGSAAVWNVEQIEGLSLDDDKITTADFTPLEAQDFVLERYTKSMENRGLEAPKINYTYVGMYGNHAMGDTSPNWNPASDAVTLPTEAQFNSPEEWFETLMHELVHSTGHVNRLDRTEITNAYATNKAARGLEELIAEMGAAILGEMFGVNYDFENTTAYVESWQKAISEIDLSSLQKASTLAQQAVDYLLGVDIGDWSPIEGYSVGGSKPKKNATEEE